MKQYPGEIEVVKSAILAYKDYINKSSDMFFILSSMNSNLFKFYRKTSNVKQDPNDPVYKEIKAFSKEVVNFLSSNLEYFKKYPIYNIRLLKAIIEIFSDLSNLDASKDNVNSYVYKAYRFMDEFSGAAIEESLDHKMISPLRDAENKVNNELEQLDKFYSIMEDSYKKIINKNESIDDLRKNALDLIEYVNKIDKLKYMSTYKSDLTDIIVNCYKLIHRNYTKNDLKYALYNISFCIEHMHKIAYLNFNPERPSH